MGEDEIVERKGGVGMRVGDAVFEGKNLLGRRER